METPEITPSLQPEVAQVKLPVRYKLPRFWRILGPGLITGAADDDPSGIATYSQAGAQFGLNMAWTMLFTYPLMTAVQEACARIGAVQGKGLASVIKEHYSRRVLYPIVLLVVLANTLNIGADIGAMAEALRLVVPVPFILGTLGFTVIILLLEVFTSYKTYVKMLKWLAITLLAYPVTAFIVRQPWGEVARATFTPHLELNLAFIYVIVGVLGTTISPYLFFWQTSEVVEEEIAAHRLAQRGGIPRLSRRFLRNLRIDNAIGMLFSNVTAWFIIITAAAVLHQSGVHDIATAANAAKALEPLVQGFPNAGLIAKLIFATGIIGLGLLAVPVLAGSGAYALSEVFGMHEGLYRKLNKAHGFYGLITIATLAGLVINFIGVDPMKVLVFTAVFNGVAAVPLIFLIARIGRNQNIMGVHTNGKWSSFLIHLTFVVMAIAALTLFVALAKGL